MYDRFGRALEKKKKKNAKVKEPEVSPSKNVPDPKKK